MTDKPDPLTYAEAGVSLEAAGAVVERIRAAVASTRTMQVLGVHGGFAGVYTPSVGDPLIAAGDAIVGLPSSGPHANGYSLVRRLLERAGLGPDDTPTALGGQSVADALLEPTRIYARAVAELTRTVDVRAMAHITGGGIPGNLVRQFPDGVGAEIDLGAWTRPPVFDWLASLGVEEDEMRRVFNLGIGFAAVVETGSTQAALKALERGGCPSLVAGSVVEGAGVRFR